MSLLSRLAVEAARAYGFLSSNKNNVSANFLVVAGGGAGGPVTSGGGGGAGGYQTSTFTLSTLNTYSITVGAGGASATTGSLGANGSNSVISGTGLTTVTSVGGGGGGRQSGTINGAAGGSGGGGSYNAGAGGAGTSGQGNNGGSHNGAAVGCGAGGGGAGAAGSNITSSSGANGGIGLASSISGSSVYYAGGGGGGSNGGSTGVGTGGTGGGGNGSNNGATVGTAGTVNTGGGGGGAGDATNPTGFAGGSGIVIISYASATPKFVGGTLTTSGGNQIHTFTSSGTLSPLTPVTASYLVVAGGGGGGNGNGGGGGAGGLLTSTTTLYYPATYTVTVGGGGNGTTTTGVQGSNSVLSGTGITTVTSTGGGGGGQGSTNSGTTGGSGGGGGNGFAGSAGTSGQGNAGGTGVIPAVSAPAYGGGGGGGASATGSAGTALVGGAGGAGSASSISGSSVYYAGGGGGAANSGTTAGAGGTGGGGAGGLGTGGTAGTVNLGGGGGGGNGANAGGNGGSGVVIISYAGSQVFNGGLVTSSGGNTIHTFNATGALTPLTNNLNNSLRFRLSASAYLNRTPSQASNRTTYTWSAWVKRGSLGNYFTLFGAGTTAPTYDVIRFNSSDQLEFFTAGAASVDVVTTQVFRDPSAWYHIVVAVDTTQATAANRVMFYINGNQVTSFAAATYPTQNSVNSINNTVPHAVGATAVNSTFNTYFDGYMADINFIDGQALAPYYFGNNDANQVWKPIKYTGTYGTNGFYLTFGNTTSTTTLGYDSSPNGNNWTTNNISLTAGTTYDAMTDVPTLTSATVANYCVLNSLAGGGVSATDANLTLNQGSGAWTAISSTISVNSGKYYFEATASNPTAATPSGIGLTVTRQLGTGEYAGSFASGSYGAILNNTSLSSYSNGSAGTAVAGTYTSANIMQCAVDLDAGKIWFGQNNNWIGGGNPSSGTTPTFTFTANTLLMPYFSSYSSSTYANFGQRPFINTPPTGFVALNTYNLPTPTILQGNKYMDATTYTGNGSTQSITNTAGFKPDLVWVKSRSAATDHKLTDSVRGVTKALISDTTGAETTDTNGLTAFNSNGWSLGTDTNYNNNTATYVGWQWQAGQGSSSSNTSGSITSTVSVNASAGFSVVTYTSTTATSATIGHGLGIAPSMIIIKVRNGTSNNWAVYHKSLGNANWIFLNSTSASGTASGAWNTTDPTSSVFSVAVGGSTGNNWTSTAGYNYVAYCWAAIAGFSAFGSYTGNGSTDGPFIYTGFRPKYVMIKSSSNSSTEWLVWDSTRNQYNSTNSFLYPNENYAEYTGSAADLDFLSNGFKFRNTNTGTASSNQSGYTYIFAAFAESPFKISNSR